MKSTLVSDNQTAAIVEPGETSFDAPPLGITRRTKARRLSAFSAPLVFSSWNTGFDSARRQLPPEDGTVETFIGNKLGHSGSRSSASLFLNGNSCQCAARQTNFVRLRAFAQDANRRTVAVGYQHHFAALSNLGAPDSVAPFFDGTNEPSRKAAAHSIFPSRSSEASNARQTASQFGLRPFVKPAPARCRRAIFAWQVSPRHTGFQNIQNAVQTFAVIGARTFASRF